MQAHAQRDAAPVCGALAGGDCVESDDGAVRAGQWRMKTIICRGIR